MTNESSPETSVAERLWVQATAKARSTPEVTASVERLFLQLRAGLLPWAGGEGYRALLDRAIGEVEAEHPLLAGLSFLGGDDAPLATPGGTLAFGGVCAPSQRLSVGAKS